MAKCVWRGDAQPVRQTEKITITTNNAAAKTFTVTINRKSFSIAWIGSGTFASDVVGALIDAIAANQQSAAPYPEWLEVAASGYVPVAGGYEFTLTGPSDGTPFTISVAASGVGTSTITTTTTQSPSGPAWFSDPKNWSGAAVPVDGDDIVFEHNGNDCLYGIEQATLTPASITIDASYTGRIGLPAWNNLYTEYRPQYLRIGDPADAAAVTIIIGRGDGNGSGRIKLDTGGCQTTLELWKSAASSDGDYPAVLWKGTHASNAARVYRGSLGVAYQAGETATISSLMVAYVSNQESDAEVLCGDGCTLGAITKTGGSLVANGKSGNAVTSLLQWAGETVILGTDAVSSLTVRGGTVYYGTSGTLGGNTIISGDGTVDFSRDSRTKTVTNPIDVYGDNANVHDPYKVVTSLVVDYDETTRFASLGSHVRLTRGAPA